ncbi:polysaccharide biosynthesis protein [Aestuariivirga litoralis]|uniref:polysaccharide biosynthesis protein n=1 Tax=Aestuariivirga litoralis TaxID=2650924 RepID=UPI0018C5CEE2|nr:nucleoside-diphosphate sugar epimerase/dehydratase [Aestuariivirga litoralis]MBG1233231.1 polysaccharide biosynthesis protein [Aestuariivirga litoralis]
MPRRIPKLLVYLTLLPTPLKISVILAADVAAVLAAIMAARFLRVPFDMWPPDGTMHLHLSGPMFSIFSLALMGFYKTASRGHSMRSEQGILASQVLAAALWFMYLHVFDLGGLPRSMLGIYPVFATLGLVATRRLAVYLLQTPVSPLRDQERIPVFIYGAGREGLQLVDALRQGGRYVPVAFITTDYTLVGRKLAGLRVYDTVEVGEAKRRHGARQILISNPDMPGQSLRSLFEMMVGQGLSTKLVPNVNDLAAGRSAARAIRELKIEDLLGREQVSPDLATIALAVGGKTILVTGAGGSIGSELVRQCLKHRPRHLVLLDASEFALFEIHREIEKLLPQHPGLQVTAVLGDVKSAPQIEALFRSIAIDIVFHAAAYKHVRMVQENAKAGIRNNVNGTRILAEAAMKAQVQRFILISTDKAVRPTSVMGASKRLGELTVQALAARRDSKTLFCMVRFGNVLGSNGSVVPIFRDQIAKGGPVTVTHPDVTRYFMAIPEAAQLVLQAAGLARSGEVLVLDMGEPIKISKLARTMIELAGHTVKTPEMPDGDIEIRYTGLRDGEKMYEELEIGHDLSPTTHRRILRSKEYFMPYSALAAQLKKLNALLDAERIDDAVILTMELAWRAGDDVREIQPSVMEAA